MNFTNSPLVNFTQISPNKTVNRGKPIDTITIHCYVGQVTVERMGKGFADPARQASSNYGVGLDGKIGLFVEEKDRSWCTGGLDKTGKPITVNGISGRDNDFNAITIETACDSFAPYAVTDAAYNALIELCADICKRNGIPRLVWKGDKSLVGKPAEQNMTVHRWFANKSCPGDYLYERLGDIAAKVNAILDGKPTPEPVPPLAAVTTVKEWQSAAIADGYKFPKYGADGKWGTECEGVAKKALCRKLSAYTNKNLTRIVQKAVGVTVDGLFGKNTDAAVRTYQKQNGLTVDGIVGLNTWKKILKV